MSKISNVILFLQLLSTGRKYSIKELSSKLEVSERMVRVYKEELEKSGIYIDSIMGPYGGYVLRQPIKLPIMSFQLNEFQILNFYIQKESDLERREQLILLQNKIKGLSFLQQQKLEFDPGTSLKYNVFTRAIKEKRKIRILYQSYKNGETERIICPASMFLFQDGWCCAAFCELRKDMRQFELKRVLDFELLEEMFM